MRRNSRNPWMGLGAYDEHSVEQGYLFCGRDRSASELARLIESCLCVTLYGRTGIGKSSLLNAGVFPLLRKAGFVPVSVRLGRSEKDAPATFAERIVQAVAKTFADGKIDCSIPAADVLSTESEDYLWQYFATNRFYDADGAEVSPVIVLDQFEENFTAEKDKNTLLLRQIASLIGDNKIFPEGYNDATNFRIVLSIREDDLYRLEDAIDTNSLSDLKAGRYRLVQLTDAEAREVVEKPGDAAGCFGDDREAVVDAILASVRKANGGEMNTLDRKSVV